MFDDYVEHSASSALGGRSLQYQGFEPSAHEGDDTAALEDAHIQGNIDLNPSLPPIFDLGRVQFPFPATLTSFVACSDWLAMAFSSNVIVLIELAKAEHVIKMQIPRKPADMSIHKLFMDPAGRHIIVSSVQGENWYIFGATRRPRQLEGFKMVIESIAWNKTWLLSNAHHSTSTREILIGTRNGTIYEAVLDSEEGLFKSQERYLQSVFILPERHRITGIHFDYFPPSDPKKAWVVVTTPTRMYQFFGVPDRKAQDPGRVFSSLFASYRDTTPKTVELPSNIQYSELHLYTSQDQPSALPKAMAWLTGSGMYQGNLSYNSNIEEIIDVAHHLPYPDRIPEIPRSLALTEFHFIFLYKDRVVAVCNLDQSFAYEEPLPLKPTETVLGLAVDPARKTYWVYTDQSLFELVIANEDRDIWRIYLTRGQHDLALKYTKTPAQRNYVLALQADAAFNEKRYFRAAQCYAQSSTSFEDVALKFLDVGERDALRSYLIMRLERTRKGDLTQRMILATWLVEFYLSKCNELDDLIASESVSHNVENLQAERTILEDDLRQFFDTYKNNLDRTSVYELILGHGKTDMYLYYANVVGDFERVIEHWILEEEWLKALEIISRQSDLELYYRFGPVLMRHAPRETVDCWLRQPNLDHFRLIPSILQSQHTPPDPLCPNQAIRYLNHLIFDLHNSSPTIHNLLITLHVTNSTAKEDDGPLLRFLSTSPSDPLTRKPYYDLDYALRLCKSTGRTQPCVHIYSKMGLWEDSVDLALDKGDVELAKINADMPEDDEPLRRKLWLKIARYVVQDKKDIKTAMRFLESTDLLKIEDILPFFPDFVVIDDFKEEIAHALEGYSSHIEALKRDMNEATQTADSLKRDIVALKNRFITIDAGEQCSVCSHLLLSRQFYVFPCRHSFHADCLVGLVKEYLPPHTLRKIISLQNELTKGTTANQPPLLSVNFENAAQPANGSARAANLIGRNIMMAGDRLRDLIVPDALVAAVWVGGRRTENGDSSSGKTQGLREELEDILASSCPLCESVVAGLDRPFVKEGEVDAAWEL